MKNSFKKLTAWLCCMALLISFIPAAALEAQTLPTTGGSLSGDYVLTGETTLSAGATVSSGTVTIDLNGQTLKCSSFPAFTVTGGKLIITDSSTGGQITGKTSGSTNNELIAVSDSGEFVLDGGTITGHKPKTAKAVVHATGGTVTINGGDLSGTTKTSFTKGGDLYATNATVNINGGKVGAKAKTIMIDEGATLNLSGAPTVNSINAKDAELVEFGEMAQGASVEFSDVPTAENAFVLSDSIIYDEGEKAYIYTEPKTKYDVYKVEEDTNGSYNITVGGETVDKAAEGDVVTLVATPNSGYLVDSYYAEGNKLEGNTFVMPARKVGFKVTFKEDTRTFTATVGTVTLGTVKLNGQDSVTGKAGTTVTVTPIPAQDTYDLVGIYVDGVKLEADNGVYSFAIKADAQNVVTATFVDPEAGEAFAGTIASGGKYYLSDDFTLEGGLTVSGEVTIDLMGNTLSGTAAPYFTIGENAKLTIKDSVDGGEVNGITADKAMIVINGGEFVLEGGKLTGHTNTSTSLAGAAIHMDASGSIFTMNGGEISGNTATYRGGAIGTVQNANIHTININGGTIGANTGKDGRGVNIYVYTNNGTSNSPVNITGGIIELGKDSAGSAVIGKSGSENVWLRKVALTVSGNPVVRALHMDSNPTSSIGTLTAGAEIKAASALTVAEGNTTVTTAKVGDFNVYTYNPQPMTITVDTNITGGSLSAATTAKYGDTVTVTAIPNSGYALKEIIVKDTATGEVLATITDGNTFTMFDCNVTVTATFVAMTAEQTMVTLAPVQPAEGGTVTVTGVELGQVVAAGAEVTVTAAPATGWDITVTVNGTAVPLTNNTYTFTAQGGQSYSIAATAAKIDYDVTVAYGEGSLEGVEVNELAETAKCGDEITVTVPTGYLLESITVKDAANGDVAVTDGKFTMPASDVTITVVIKEMPLADGGELPLSGKLENPAKYTLTGDVVLTGGLTIASVVEIDLNGHTISMDESVVPVPKFFDIAAGAKLTIKDSSEEQDGKVQFKNVVPNPLPEGKTVSDYSNPGVNISGTFVLEGGELTGWSRIDAAGTAGAGGMVFVQPNGTFTMKGGKLTGANASSASAIRAENDGAVVNLLGGEITGNNTSNVIVNVGKGTGSVTPAQLNVGGDFKIYGNTVGGVPYTYENYEIKFQNANATISGTPELGMVAADANGALEISGAPVINSLRATLNDDGTLKVAKSITLGELEEGALIITGGGLILEKAGTEIPEGITSVYWNNQEELGTWYQGHIYLPAIEPIYGEPMSNITLPGNGLLTWADEEGTFDQAGDAEADVVVNGVTIKLPVTVAAKEIEPAIGAIAAQYYNGEAIEPTLVVTYGEETLVEGEDYTVTYADNTYPGTASVTIEPVEGGRYTFDTEAEYAKATFVINKGEATTATIERVVKVSGETLEIAIADYLPAGYGEADVVSVVNGDFITVSDTLVDGKLVVTAAASALNAEDEATVVVGMTHYENATLTLSVKAIERVVPTGVPATYGQTLAERGVPAYGWEWLNPSELVGDVGTHTFQAYFNGDKNDVADVTVIVSAKEEFTDLTYTLDKDTVVFTGVAVTPVVTVKDGDTVLELGKDYTVTYEGNDKKNPAAKVIIEAMGNYKFTVEKTFAITEGVSTAGATKKQYYNAVSDTVTIAQLSASEFKVPVNAGDVAYTLNSYTEGKLSNVKVENGVVSYTIGFTTPGTATIVVDVTFDNYAATTITLTVEMLQKTSTNDPIVAPGAGGGGGGGGFMEPEVDDEPGTTVTTDDNGNKVTTTTDKNGNSTVVVEATNGVTATTTSDLYGKYTTNVVIPSSAVSGSEPVVLPVEGKGQATVDVPGTIEVEFPVETMTPGTIAVIVNADGTEELIQEAKQTESGMLIVLTEDCTVKVYDNAKSFDDVSGHWSKDAVSYVTARGMFAGTGNGSTFSPDVKMTRAMLAQVIYNLEGAEDHSYDANFTDIDDGAWYSKAVNWAASEGIVSGYGDNSYQPDKALTREEVVQIFFNYAKSKGYDMSHSADLSTFADGHNVSDWAKAAKQWAVGAGLISGKGGNILDAKGGATRGEGAQMFMNFCNNIVE